MSTPGELLEALGREARARFPHVGTGGGEGGTRTFRGRSVEELVPQIQRQLGDDAIIVRRRDGLTGGVLGFFQHPFVEIEAMAGAPGVDVYDEESAAQPSAAEPPAAEPPPTRSPVVAPSRARPPVEEPSRARPPAERPPAAEPPGAEPPDAPREAPPLSPAALAFEPDEPQPPPRFSYSFPRQTGGGAPEGARAPDAASANQGMPDGAYVTARLAALARSGRPGGVQRRALASPPPPAGDRLDEGFEELAPRELSELLASPPPMAEAGREPPGRGAQERRAVPAGSHSRARAGVARTLERRGMGEELARELIDGASAHALALAPRAGLARAVRATLAQRIPVAGALPTRGAAIAVVGAGGAGKTTCCAALLGAYRRAGSLPASCATVAREEERTSQDAPGGARAEGRTRRGAGGQAGGELSMILSPHLMKPAPARAPSTLRALRRARDEGVAVVDTPGVSPSDRAGVRELARLLDELAPERVVVALPATLGARAAAQLLEALAPLKANALALTHADETDQIGVGVEAACRFGLAPEYMLERARGGGWRLRALDPCGLAERLLP